MRVYCSAFHGPEGGSGEATLFGEHGLHTFAKFVFHFEICIKFDSSCACFFVTVVKHPDIVC